MPRPRRRRRPSPPAASPSRAGRRPRGGRRAGHARDRRGDPEGLDWLATQQNADGSFGSGAYRGNIAVTSLAGLAFMASGSTPGRGPYGAQIDKALQYVMDNTSPSGFISVPNAATHGPMYSHGFGTLFLAEAYGMTHRARDPREAREGRPPDRRHPERRGRLALPARPQRRRPLGHDLPDQRPPRRPQRRDLRAQGDRRGLHPVRQAVAEPRRRLPLHAPGGRQRLPTLGGRRRRPLTAPAVYDGKEVEKGIAYLKQFIPEIKLGSRYSHYFYGHYYAAQAIWIRGGDDWSDWYPAIRDELLRTQPAEGYWTDTIGNEYGTAMALIILQMPNNYLPIFQR